MNILFVHQNFPGQFRHLAPALVARGHQVTALTMVQGAAAVWEGVKQVSYRPARGSSKDIHPWVIDLETKVIRGEAALRVALSLRTEGYVPDVVIAHPGWGESLFLKEVWPSARLGIYCEFFYNGADNAFDPEFSTGKQGDEGRLRLKNINNLLHFDSADAGLSPTHWQASTFPAPFRDRIRVVHDGIDTEALKPNNAVSVSLASGLNLTRTDEVITFVNRNLEPYRGYHVFMRALPELLRRRPRAHVLIVGGEGVSYGAPAPAGRSWKQVFYEEVRLQMDETARARIHFVGKLPYPQFIGLLQLSTVHVYLTYPFVLSWSLLEAMSVGCAIVASDTQPVREVISHGETGRLVPFFDKDKLVDEIEGLLRQPEQRRQLGFQARSKVCNEFDLRRVCLPRQLEWVDSLFRPKMGLS